MKFSYRGCFWNILKYGVSLLCLIYAFRGVPLADLWTTLTRYPVLPMLSVMATSFAAYALMGLRLSRMAIPPFSFRSTFSATLVGLAVNNVLPAKAGEVAKAVWMGKANNAPFDQTLGIVFMERFFDVNLLAFFSLWFLWLSGEKLVVEIFVLCLVAGWSMLLVFRLRPSWVTMCLRLLGSGRVRDFAQKFLNAILDQMTVKRLVWMTVMSGLVWSFYAIQMAVGLNGVAGLNLSWDVVLSVFAISGLSMLLPSSPGALGVYEAFTVTVLRHHGVSQDQALAIALFSHMAQFIPVTLVGGLIFTAFPQKSTCPPEY